MDRSIEDIVRRALDEDIGSGDITTWSVVADSVRAMARMTVKSPGVLAGVPVVEEVFRQLDPAVAINILLLDGAAVGPGDVVCTMDGPARSILTGERVALNFVQRLSGISTRTAGFVKLVEGTRARIVDTRKTTPGLRILEKYAVRVGGGSNHRMGLFDAVMIKDNHIVAAGSIKKAVTQARKTIPHTMTVTVECETLEQVDEALAAGADILLLDNMGIATMAESVRRAKGRALTEASGGVNESTVAEIARTGVNIISVGALTHSAAALDISLDFDEITAC